MSLFKMIKERDIRGTIDYLRVFYEVARGADLRQVSVSPRKMKRLRLKEQFNAVAKYPEVFDKGQFVFFGDTNHTDISLHRFFYSPDNVKAMAAAGIKHIFPEIEPEYQDLVDDVASGKMKPRDFALAMLKRSVKGDQNRLSKVLKMSAITEKFESLELWADAFRLMRKSGMKIHCLDDRSNLAEEDIKQVGQFMSDIKNYIATTTGFPAIMHGRILVKFLIDNAAELNLKDFDQMRLYKARMADDPALAQRMLVAAGDEKGAILFGAGHAKNPKSSLFACIGKDKAVRVDLYSKIDYYADRISAMDGKGAEPNFVHILDENKLYKFKGFGDLRP